MPTDPAAVPRIAAPDVWERIRRGERVVVVDVRRKIAHDRVHIAGDVLYPPGEHDRRGVELPPDALLVLY